MSKLIIATNNQGKVREMKALLAGVYDEVCSLRDEGIAIEVVEDGTTFLENAAKKAVETSLLTEADVVADDSGLCVDALSGAPGVYSARYAGEHATDEENRQKLLLEMKHQSSREAKFVCAIVLARKGNVLFSCEGECGGVIAQKPEGEGGFGYDSLFYSKEYGQTFAQLDATVKNQISHRAKALAALKEHLS